MSGSENQPDAQKTQSEIESEKKREDHIELNKQTFWKWVAKPEPSPESQNVNLDKIIPGFASLIAVALFIVQEFIVHEDQRGNFFTDLTFTISLQVLNIIVLIIFLVRGLKIPTVPDADHLLKYKINTKHIIILETP